MAGNIDFTIPAVLKSQQVSFVASSTIDAPNPASLTYSWSAPDFNPATYEGTTFTSTAPATPGTYPVTLTAHRKNYCDVVKTNDVVVPDCTPPGGTVNFTAFDPCSNAATGDYWYLTDTRESNNIQTYKVKLMPDGHIWMVQDLKFGDKCNKNTYNGFNGKNQTGNVTSLTDQTYYGDCTSLGYAAARINSGYHYSWPAAINNPNADSDGNYQGCSGTMTSTSACRGICPMSWHVPTGSSFGEQGALYAALGCVTSSCFTNNALFESVPNGLTSNNSWSYNSYFYVTSSTRNGANVYFYATDQGIDWSFNPAEGHPIRCVMNY
jgi:uncharacterized protein (TIGR02145 family)